MSPTVLRPADILEHFLSRAAWVDRRTTVDRIIVGSPVREIHTCAVCWMPGRDELCRAARAGAELVIAHEPTFWDHFDNREAHPGAAARKLADIERRSLTVMRLHDSWDRWPEYGVTCSWARWLGLKHPPVAESADGYQRCYEITPVRFGEFARKVAARCARLGEPGVQVIGDLNRVVRRIGIGTGCGCAVERFIEIGCDCSVVCDDGVMYWGGMQLARDVGHPLVRVSHGTSEEPSIRALAVYLRKNFPGLRVIYLRRQPPYRCILGQDVPGTRGRGSVTSGRAQTGKRA